VFNRGVQVDAWVSIENECPVSYSITGGVAEFSLGSSRYGFQFDASQDALERLIAAATEALAELRSRSSLHVDG
jgi:hypothetical protein